MEVANRCLKDDGIFVLHTIGTNKNSVIGEPWMDKYIFPDGMLPSPVQLTKAIQGLFMIEDWHNFGSDYYKTLKEWQNNLNKNWQQVSYKYDDRFKRMFNYFLMYFLGHF